MNKIEHIGIAVKDIEQSIQLFSKLLNTQPYKREKVETEGVETVFFQVGETKIELLGATREDSPVAKFIEKKGEGIHHISFDVSDINQEITRLQEQDFTILNTIPKQGADNKKIAFLHPKSTNGVLTELCQEAD